MSANYQAVLYRKWRPKSFNDLVGQESIVQTLVNSISNNQMAHAYLFSGPRGTGKTTAGRIFAATVNCDSSDMQCVEAFFDGSALSLIELDAASNRGIDEIRNLKENIAYMVGDKTYKIYLIDEVHMLTDAAFNALLKTLEEPPEHVIFILATTEPHKVPATVHSRCQRFDFHKISTTDTVNRLSLIAQEESISISDEALTLIARFSQGSLRDAINLLEQSSISINGDINIDDILPILGIDMNAQCAPFLINLVNSDLEKCLSSISEMFNDGVNFKAFKDQLLDLMRALLHDNNANFQNIITDQESYAELRQLLNGQIHLLTLIMKKISAVNFYTDHYYPLPLEIAIAEICSGNVNENKSTLKNTDNAHNAAMSSQERDIKPKINQDAVTQVMVEETDQTAPEETDQTTPEETDQTTPEETDQTTLEDAEQTISTKESNKAAANNLEGSNESIVELAISKWASIKSEARKGNNKAGALMNSGCFVKGINDNILIIGFKFGTHVDLVKNSDNGSVLIAIQNAVNNVLNTNLVVQVEIAEEIQNDSVGNEEGQHLVDEAIKRGAKIVE
ncbi:MAG: hypothetical protein CL872_03700 [Dehalococcoidaceae bacterium]|nr:hypothetical protein [Dehalococcoidaceae bacterium]